MLLYLIIVLMLLTAIPLFRFSTYQYVSNGIQYRTLVKAYGIRVIVHVNGLVSPLPMPFEH